MNPSLDAEDAELHDALVLLLARLLSRELQPPDQVDPAPLLHLAVLQDGEVVVDEDLQKGFQISVHCGTSISHSSSLTGV